MTARREARKIPCPRSKTSRGLSQCQDAIQSAWDERIHLRFNRGITGRSLQYFSFAYLERVSKLLSYDPSTLSNRAELIGL